MKASHFVKWSVEGGAEGYQVDLTPEDIGQSSAGDINLALDQARILFYLATYLIYSREVADKRMLPEDFDKAMANYGYERRLVSALMKPAEVTALEDKVVATKETHASGK